VLDALSLAPLLVELDAVCIDEDSLTVTLVLLEVANVLAAVGIGVDAMAIEATGLELAVVHATINELVSS